ncbi:MAG: M48 family metalloprotease [Terracidiphilus sp.]
MATTTPSPTTAPQLICPQGHGPGVPGSRFCTWCGSGLVPPPAPGQPVPAAQAQPAPPAQPQPQPASFLPPMPTVLQAPKKCTLCGNTGAGLKPSENVCPECGWLRPFLPGYQLDRSVFLWKQDGQAMMKLQKLPALHSIVRSVSDRVGRPWIESTYNGILLGPNQLPHIWQQAVLAARVLGLPTMPDVYVSGGQMWESNTFGSDTSSFIVMGTAILTNFQNDEVFFLLAREMGHCRAGHALWKTVIRFLAGDTGMHSGILSQGILNAISPTKLIEGALEMPLMAWSRQSEVTADRAGLLAVGDEALARRVLLAWSIRSNRLLKQVNLDEWMKQEQASDDALTRISEMTTSSSMYTSRRLRLIGESAREPELMRWSQTIQPIRKRLAPTAPAEQAKPAAAAAPPSAPADSIRVICTKCQAAMRVPFAVLRGKTSLNVRCPKCHNVLTLRPKPPAPPAPAGSDK